ncbi:hypothetical protein BC628DRAFT_50668 [Trametes gibbosa]|nr:hypothetical protein BC628DRAFT_50668 [Trametes gibbosa]
MSRVRLDQLTSLIFYKDKLTAARRAPPVPQLTCIGKPCRLYQPDVVRCVSLGGHDTDVSWKCEADLPEALRFGAVEVLCEGYDRPGDPYVLKGSCGLEYRLVQIPDSLRGPGAGDPAYPYRFFRWLNAASDLSQDPAAAFFMLLWVGVLGLIIYSILSSCFRSRNSPTAPRTPGSRPWWGPSSGSSWFSGNHPDIPNDPPPPYSPRPKNLSPSTQAPGTQGDAWRPGFWTGAALGGLGAHLFNRPTRGPGAGEETWARRPPARAGMYDWEAEQMSRPARPAQSTSWFGPRSGGGGVGSQRQDVWDRDDRGEGPSNSGSMRTSTGMGGSRVR